MAKSRPNPADMLTVPLTGADNPLNTNPSVELEVDGKPYLLQKDQPQDVPKAVADRLKEDDLNYLTFKVSNTKGA